MSRPIKNPALTRRPHYTPLAFPKIASQLLSKHITEKNPVLAWMRIEQEFLDWVYVNAYEKYRPKCRIDEIALCEQYLNDALINSDFGITIAELIKVHRGFYPKGIWTKVTVRDAFFESSLWKEALITKLF